MEFFRNTNFDFVGAMKPVFLISAALVLATLIGLVVIGPRLSIDFTGGTVVQVRITPPAGIHEVRGLLEKAGYGDAQVQDFSSSDEYLITLAKAGGTAADNGPQAVLDALRTGLADRTVELRREETVGPKIGKELTTAAANAVALAIVLICVYVWFRFIFRYGLASIVALFHDVVLTIGLFVFLRLEISLPVIAAFLTILGYSINDTIVVFDRIRENMKLRRKESYDEVINRSINETLSRTIITSGTTLACALTLYLFGGPVIHDFAFALTFGITVGTYSSIFIASPILVFWHRRFNMDRKRAQPSM
jgi:preprotein translocase subunit SecF